MINRFTIYGERCSGTNYLEKVILSNFDMKLTWDFGYKHFFGFSDFKDSDDVLFIGIVRDPVQWINSFYKKPWEIPTHISKDAGSFLNSQFYSVINPNPSNIYYKVKVPTECMEDRNIYTGERYRNIFEMRYTKINFLRSDLPKKVKHYLFVRYEDMLEDFDGTVSKILQFKELKDNIKTPVNVYNYKGIKGKKFIPKNYTEIGKTEIFSHPDFDLSIEKSFNYI